MAIRLDTWVDEALRRVAPSVESTGERRWMFSLRNGAVLRPRAHLTSGWLELSALLPAGASGPAGDVALSRMNTRLDGSVRVARTFGEPLPHIKADVCIERRFDLEALETWLRSACNGLTHAAHLVISGCDGTSRPPATLYAEPFAVTGVAQLCRESGWPVVSEDESSVRVELVTRAGVHRAFFGQPARAAAGFVVELADLTGQSHTSRRAVAAMLLAVSGSVRLVKGGLFDRDGSTAAVLMSAPIRGVASSVDDSLSALAVACQMSGREIVALLDERLAAEYLAISTTVNTEDTKDTEEETSAYAGAGFSRSQVK